MRLTFTQLIVATRSSKPFQSSPERDEDKMLDIGVYGRGFGCADNILGFVARMPFERKVIRLI